ncbi:MAG: FapA family protein [Treponema sp.]|jgi:uncharacterized protein (DUF342 family)|nr:FapA family protein [Treponema sp.]
MDMDKNQGVFAQCPETPESPMPQNQIQQNRTARHQAVITRDNPYSGNMILYFFDDDLEVRGDFMPPIGAGAPLTMEIVEDFLKQLNIVYGIEKDVIQKAVSDCTLEKQPVKDVIVAKGDPPVAEVVDYFEINPRLVASPPPADKNDRIDYRSYSPFIIVKKDQALARLKPGISGKAGKNVYGGVIPYQTVHPPGVTGGINTRTGGKFISAEINGQFVREKNTLHVQKSLIIKGGVGYATGNIAFPGDVVIEGPVSDGFKIYAGGSVQIKQTFDVTEVLTGGDLNVAGGIIGRCQARIKVRGDIKTKFIENCQVACRKTVMVEKEVINSTIYAMEHIDLGDKGFIVGGDMTAIHGIRAGKIGKRAGRSTKLHCGIDFTVQQEQEKANSQFQLLTAKIEKIQKLMVLPGTGHEKRLKLETLLRRTEEEQQKAGNRVSDLLGRINVDENATVEVYGEIAPGTLIEICHIALFAAEPMRKVRIKLDKFYGKLTCEPL